MGIEQLKELDNLRKIPFELCECYIHEDHRWVLPVLYYAQERSLLPKPCTLVMFDAHDDCQVPGCNNSLNPAKMGGLTLDKIIDLCKDELNKNDDDWVIAGMELGLIGNCVIFGVENTSFNCNRPHGHTDLSGKPHEIRILEFPGRELDYRGNLSDLARRDDLKSLWQILGWKQDREKNFDFAPDDESIWVDFDLDCFVVRSRLGYKFPWPDEVFEGEFKKPCDHSSTKKWTGKSFLAQLINRAGLLTIARESGFCGGEEKCDEILAKINHHLFNGKLQLSN